MPTVVDAATIVHDSMADLLDALEEEEQKEFLEEMISPKLYTMFVTPKDVDETVRYLSFTISEGLNMAFSDSLIEVIEGDEYPEGILCGFEPDLSVRRGCTAGGFFQAW